MVHLRAIPADSGIEAWWSQSLIPVVRRGMCPNLEPFPGIEGTEVSGILPLMNVVLLVTSAVGFVVFHLCITCKVHTFADPEVFFVRNNRLVYLTGQVRFLTTSN